MVGLPCWRREREGEMRRVDRGSLKGHELLELQGVVNAVGHAVPRNVIPPIRIRSPISPADPPNACQVQRHLAFVFLRTRVYRRPHAGLRGGLGAHQRGLGLVDEAGVLHGEHDAEVHKHKDQGHDAKCDATCFAADLRAAPSATSAAIAPICSFEGREQIEFLVFIQESILLGLLATIEEFHGTGMRGFSLCDLLSELAGLGPA
mmetsp:Transcript_146013/g.468242  ORF Transcript_146013/g.468242 Transcript_146013/m.468242 type:complete len:205 (+) Transcript_146013:850-1464(+)